MNGPTILNVKRHDGVAGQYSLSVVVQYAGEPAETVEFIGSVYGSPIVMVTNGNPGGVFVDRGVSDRCGVELTPEWVRRFFEPREGQVAS